MSASKPAVPEPTEIDGRYSVEKKLGAGAFGTVYKARDKELGRLVAIKTIRLEGLAASTSSLEDLLKRFKQEAQGRGQPQAPQHRRPLRLEEHRGLQLPLDGVRGRRGARPGDRRVGEDVDRARGGDRRPGGGRSRLRAPERRRPPRHQAREHHDRARGPREGHRLRHREDDRPGSRAPHGDREPPRDAVLHEPGAGPRGHDRRPQRPLLGRLHPLRDARRPQGVPRRVDHGPPLQDHHGGASLPARARPDGVGRDAAHHRQGPLEITGDPLPVRPRARRRPARGDPAGLRADAPRGRHADASPGRAARRRAHDRFSADHPARAHHRLGRDGGPAGDDVVDAAGPRGAATAAPDDPDPADRARGAARPRRQGDAPRSSRAAARVPARGPQGKRRRPDRRPRARRGPRARGDRGRRLVSLRSQGTGAAGDGLRRLDSGDRGSPARVARHRDATGGEAPGGSPSGRRDSRPGADTADRRPGSRWEAPRHGRRRPPPRPRHQSLRPRRATGGGDYAYLDDVPAETADGRAAGEALAQKYRSGGSGSPPATPRRVIPVASECPPA